MSEKTINLSDNFIRKTKERFEEYLEFCNISSKDEKLLNDVLKALQIACDVQITLYTACGNLFTQNNPSNIPDWQYNDKETE